jgi:PIN domain nuclease of toxin-antitoxin system
MILLDTHAAVWLFQKHRRARQIEGKGRLHLSPTSLLELQILVEAGRLEFHEHFSVTAFVEDVRWRLDEPPAASWFLKAAEVGWTRDPFDRLLVGHVRLRGWKLATADSLLLDHLNPSERLPL